MVAMRETLTTSGSGLTISNSHVREAVESAAAAVLCVTRQQLTERANAATGLRFDSPQAEAIIARAENEIGHILAEVADLDSGVPATLDSLTSLLSTKLSGLPAVPS